MIDYKKKVEKICKEAGNQQWIYWTNMYSITYDFPKYDMRIGDIKTDADERKFLNLMDEMNADKEFDKHHKACKDAKTKFDGLLYKYNCLSEDMIKLGIRKRHLRTFYSQMIKFMDKDKAADMARCKFAVTHGKDWRD